MQASVTRVSNRKKESIFEMGLVDVLTHLFMFISTLLIGADLIGINVGVNFRLDQLFLLLTAFLLLIGKKYRLYQNYVLLFFIFFSLVSTVLSVNITRGILFYCSIIYNVLFVYFVYTNYIYFYGLNKFLSVYRKTMVIQFILMCLQYILKVIYKYDIPFMPSYGTYMGIPRFCLWFYEPSYLATYVCIWYTFGLYMFLVGKQKKYIYDVIMSFVMILLSTSTSGFISIFLAGLVIYFIWIYRGISIKKILFLFAAFLLVLLFLLLFKDIYNVFIKRLFNTNLNAASGGRVELWNETYKVYKENSLFGIGPGNYGIYLNQDPGYVPSNVTLEIMATLGIFSCISFYMLSLILLYRCYKYSGMTPDIYKIRALCVSLIIFTIILQFNQGYLRLYHWMLLGVLDGIYRCCLRGIKNPDGGQYGKSLY